MFLDVPGAPRGLECVETSGRAITIEWQAPDSDGGAPIRGYLVERRQGFSSRFINVSRGLVLDRWYRDNNVYEGSDYEYRVIAENEAGQGNPSKPVGPVVAKEPFGESLK